MPETLPSKVSISRKVKLGIVFTLLMLALIALVSFISMRRFITMLAEIAEGREILERSERAQRYFVEMESSARAYLLTGKPADLVPYEHGLSFIVQELKGLSRLVQANAEQQGRLSRIQDLVRKAFDVYTPVIHKRRDGVEPAATLYSSEEYQRMAASAFRSVLDELNDFSQSQRSHLNDLRDSLERNRNVNNSLLFGGIGLTFIVLITAGFLVLRDIAERRIAEETLAKERNILRGIMDAIPDLIYVKDAKGRLTRDNLAHRRHLGLATEEEVVGKTNDDFYPQHIAARYSMDDLAVLSGSKSVVNAVEPSRTAEGETIWVETTKVPLIGPDGSIVGLVGVSSDITQRRADEEQLKHFAAALQRSNEELQNFASVASHDLQEPLRKIQSFGNLLQARHGSQLGEQGTDYLRRMMDAANRMQTLIQDLLKLSRVTTRAQPFEKVDLAEIVRGVLSDLEVKISSTGARVATAGLGVVEADPTQMRQLFQNLIANGLKFQKPGAVPAILVAARTFTNEAGELPQLPRNAQVCEVRVQDNGIGFDQQFADQIFSPFKRLHARGEFEGSGIGLTLCRKITDRHRGRIVAQSTDGQGATFIVTLPVNQPLPHERRSEAHYHPDGR